jgi:hypothetical protein
MWFFREGMVGVKRRAALGAAARGISCQVVAADAAVRRSVPAAGDGEAAGAVGAFVPDVQGKKRYARGQSERAVEDDFEQVARAVHEPAAAGSVAVRTSDERSGA